MDFADPVDLMADRPQRTGSDMPTGRYHEVRASADASHGPYRGATLSRAK